MLDFCDVLFRDFNSEMVKNKLHLQLNQRKIYNATRFIQI